MMEPLLFLGLPIAIVFAILLKLSSMPRLEKARAYILPLICGSLLAGWAIWSTYHYVIDERDDPAGLLRLGILLIILYFILGGGIGRLLYLGLKLWLSRDRFASAILIFYGFVLAVVSVPAVYIILMVHSDWRD